MTAIPPIVVSFGRAGSWTDIVKTEQWDWEKAKDVFARVPPLSDAKDSKGWYSTATFRNKYRHGDNLDKRTAILWDQDKHGDPARAAIVAALRKAGIAYIAYATHSSVPGQARTRVVIPSDREMSGEEYECVSRVLAENLGVLHLLAKESHVPAQMAFMPLRKPGGETWSDSHGRSPVSVDGTLGELIDWTCRAYWPCAPGDEKHDTSVAKGDPRDKEGVVGAFCRAYDIAAAIEKFELPYEPTSNPQRFTYTLGSRTEGAVLYDEGQQLHSNHDTDPAHGQHNAYDLVCKHKFDSNYELFAEYLASDVEFLAELRGTACEFEALPDPVSEVEEEFAKLEEQVAKGEQSNNQFRVQVASEYLNAKPQSWLIKGVLPRAETIMIYGESGAGKTFIALDMLAAINRGIPWRGKKTKKMKTVLLAAEGAGGARTRLKAYQMFNEGVVGDDLPALIDTSPDLRDAKQVAELALSLKRYSPEGGVLMIDTLAASMPGSDENSGKDVGQILRNCKVISTKSKFTVILIHHSGKDASKGARGWSGLKANVDAQMCVTRTGDKRSIDCTKQKDGEDGAKFGFKLKVVQVGTDEDGDAITSCVCEPDGSEGKAIAVSKVVGREKYNDKCLTTPQAAMVNIAREMDLPIKVPDLLSEHTKLDMSSDVNKARESSRKALTALRQSRVLVIENNVVVSVRDPDSS